jgi:hypothetical protein
MQRLPMKLSLRSTWRLAVSTAYVAAAALSAMLCLALVVLGVRSYWVWEDLYLFQAPAYATRGTMPFLADVRSSGGGLSLGFLKPQAPLPPEEVRRTARDFPPYLLERIAAPPIYPRALGPPGTAPSPPWLGRVGISWASWPSRTEFATYDVWAVALPYWLPALLAAVLPVVWVLPRLRRFRRWRRHRRGLCRVCGYDLRATPAAGAAGGPILKCCPECGTEAW